MEIINNGLNPLLLQISLAGRGLASPKACVGVWLLVLIVFLLLLQVVLGHIAGFWLGVGVGGVRAAEEWVLCGSGGA